MALPSTTNSVLSSGVTLDPGNGTLSIQLLVGSGAPAIAANKGSVYFNTVGSSTSTRIYVQGTTGSTTGWFAVTTAS